MKKCLIFISLVFSSTLLFAQDNFYFSQYFQVGPVLNPAMTGVDNFLDIKLNYRNQWSGFSGAPSSNYFGINGYLQKETQEAYRQYSLRTSDPQYLDKLPGKEISLGERIRHGIGGVVVYDIQGPYEQINGNINYAMHLPVGKKVKLSIGIAASIVNQRINLEKITLKDPDNDQFYQSLLANGGKNTYIDINPGMLFYGDHFYLSYSIQSALRFAISTDDLDYGKNETGQIIMAGLSINLSSTVRLLPSGLYNFNQRYDNVWEGGAKLLISEKIWAGMSYRSTSTMIFMAGIYINNLFNLGYSYDYQVSELNNYSNGSHEITLGLMLFKKDLKAPFLW